MDFSFVTLALVMYSILLVNAQTESSQALKDPQAVVPQAMVPQEVQNVVPQVVVPQVVVPQGNLAAGCFWSGTSPFCFGKCGHFYNTMAIDKRGDGKRCLSGTKKLCCPRTHLLVG